MNKLQNPHKAIIPLEKLSEYALNPEHDEGKHKARVFKSALGLTQNDAPFLQKVIQEIIFTHEAKHESSNDYGERYVIDFELTTSVGTAIIRTAWIIRFSEDFPRLTTCYIVG
ncbi:MAG: hypothetical protein SFZ02_08180 [bacterium]|nr:hypothetical protein [bacterium]